MPWPRCSGCAGVGRSTWFQTRPNDVDTSGPVWEYWTRRFKIEYHDEDGAPNLNRAVWTSSPHCVLRPSGLPYGGRTANRP